MKVSDGFILREIAGETIAIPSGDAARELSGLVALNETGKFLFELLQKDTTEAKLVETLLEEYDATPEDAQRDVADFLDMLRGGGILIED
ncbi:MAG: PqqD family protein [Ruminococcus sp.]|nr:PqqD family protein [Ruminococcus sp.]